MAVHPIWETLILLNKVNSKGAVGQKLEKNGRYGVSERFDSKLADGGNRLVTQIGKYLYWRSVEPGPLKQGDRDGQLVMATRKGLPCRHIESCPTGTFRQPSLRFLPCFSSAVRQMPGYNKQRPGTVRTVPTYGA